MERIKLLLSRLEAIGHAMEASGHALALLGLGSAGLELARLDEYSDLDFFVIVEAGFKQRYIENLDWLENICPVAYRFRNTADGYKLLFEDGVFCEFAVFTLAELGDIPYAPGRIVWKRAGVDEAIAGPLAKPVGRETKTVEWLLGEALTNLYVGLGRYRRGEKLSAARFIQWYAVERLIDLAVLVETEQGLHADSFDGERRFERRFPGTAAKLPVFVQGYERSCESALAILGFLEQHFKVNRAMARAIRELCAGVGE